MYLFFLSLEQQFLHINKQMGDSHEKAENMNKTEKKIIIGNTKCNKEFMNN